MPNKLMEYYDQYCDGQGQFTRGLTLLERIASSFDTQTIQEARAELRDRGHWNAVDYLYGVLQSRELLRVGVSGGRALIEQSKPEARKDTLTLDMFDVQPKLFA